MSASPPKADIGTIPAEDGAWTAIRSGHRSALKSGAVLPVTAAAMPGTSALYGRDRAALPSRAQHHLTLAAARLTAFANGGKYSKG